MLWFCCLANWDVLLFQISMFHLVMVQDVSNVFSQRDLGSSIPRLEIAAQVELWHVFDVLHDKMLLKVGHVFLWFIRYDNNIINIHCYVVISFTCGGLLYPEAWVCLSGCETLVSQSITKQESPLSAACS